MTAAKEDGQKRIVVIDGYPLYSGRCLYDFRAFLREPTEVVAQRDTVSA